MTARTIAARQAPARILIVDDHAAARESMADILGQAGHRVDSASSGSEALLAAARHDYRVVVTDLQMPGMNGLELVRALHERPRPPAVVMVTAHASIPTAVEAMRCGALDYLEKPFTAERLEQLVAQALQGESPARTEETPAAAAAAPALLGGSPVMQALRLRIERAAPTNETVLITGESGTGKEVVARTLHALSRRASGPWVSLNCPALSPQLMESELFGHERGAFTGADAARVGRFEAAEHGTLLLDEVTELDLALQAKLLRVLQERAFERVGSSQTVRADVRVLAATNRDLRAEVAGGRFREDLYYRLAVIPLEVPPLRQRKADIPELVEHFMQQAADRMPGELPELAPDARQLLLDYDWPGNVRELQNIVTRACVLCADAQVQAADLRPWLIAAEGGPAHGGCGVPIGVSLQEMERQLIEATLEHFQGHRARTAAALGIGLRTLTTKIREYGSLWQRHRAAG